MKKLVLLFLVFGIFGCSSMKKTQVSDNDKSNKHILPPNTASNKYSAKRQNN